MSQFSTVLKSLMSKDKRTGLALGDETGINSGTLSRLSSGVSSPDPETLGKLLTAFNLQQRKALVAGWLEDLGEQAGLSPSYLRACLAVEDGLQVSPALRRDLSIILARGGETPEFRAVLRSIAACMVPLAPDLDHLEGVADTPGPAVPARHSVTYKGKKTHPKK